MSGNTLNTVNETIDNFTLGPIPPELVIDRRVSIEAKILFRLIKGGKYIVQEKDMDLFDELCDFSYIPKYLSKESNSSFKNY